MAILRFKALELAQNRPRIHVSPPSSKVSDYFGDNAFGIKQMKYTLSPDVFERLIYAIQKGKRIDFETANAIASVVKIWALDKGATHYTHWFQPLTGSTAEKHDAFFDSDADIENFKGTALVQQEPDASSFPSGGIRSTFEARGYTAWDPSSPMFILSHTLCIPTVFVSYTGEALDYKAPLLKANEIINKAATRVCRFFDRNVNAVQAYLGCEQEYFVLDRALFNARPDLVMGGRTVFGHNPARGQQLDDHYFGSIPTRIYDFMQDFEIECLKLGIPVRTRHNEVAPSQFEVAPSYEEMNVATDHNQLMMDVMERVSLKHNLKVLFHEKPFAGLNGSGNHNNWSLITSDGINLFRPSSSARENLQFLTFFVCTVKAVHDHNELLRASVASAGNDYRLGGQEAPPAIISVFIGERLTAVLDELEHNGNIKVKKGDNMYVKLGIDKIPSIIQDNTDRNRTSPFAFTGNKFEFRAVGSESNVAAPMTVLNLAVADQLNNFATAVDKEINTGMERRLAIIKILRDYIKSSKAVRFEGDGYSEDWIKEAESRKLPHIKDTPRALKAYISKSTKTLYTKYKICTERELEARHEILLENYIKKIQIESRIMGDLALNHIIPTSVTYQNMLIQNANGLKGLEIDNSAVIKTIQEISEHIDIVKNSVYEMIEERKRINKITDIEAKAIAYCDDVKSKYFKKIRYSVDKLELYVDSEVWPLPKYRELLFIR
ncbi:glutamine synthetase III [Chondrinema litorale]|uniref:glutamine synthetase III family protein n=1 Tax=Chondrinema litorale TaxID=2994555 RepID=UPI002543B468|nr:glutamine synthetase III [Chondrinema litorale]UZR94060.1 glutamine synthetase III [Chondrinema litorale]